MKTITRYSTLLLTAAILALTPSAMAAACCAKAAKAARQGKVCEKCVPNACCKEALAKLPDSAKKPCESCAAKEKAAKKA